MLQQKEALFAFLFHCGTTKRADSGNLQDEVDNPEGEPHFLDLDLVAAIDAKRSQHCDQSTDIWEMRRSKEGFMSVQSLPPTPSQATRDCYESTFLVNQDISNGDSTSMQSGDRCAATFSGGNERRSQVTSM